MLIKIIGVAIIFLIAFFLLKGIVFGMNANNCKDCKGKGYWQGTRGEKNTCKTCNGSGKKG